MTKRTPEQYIALRTEVRAMTTEAIIALRGRTQDQQVHDCCTTALAARGIYDIPEQSAEEKAREEAALGRAYRAMR